MIAAAAVLGASGALAEEPKSDRSFGSVSRLPRNPIIAPELDASIGKNIGGPSPIRVPDWVPNPLGRYYLYFADHKGKLIRLAYADEPAGPWRIHKPGALPLSESFFTDHVASPEAVVDQESRRIRLYYHGLTPEEKAQHTRVAISKDGLSFAAQKEPVGPGSAYWRLFRYDGAWYALAMPGKLLRSKDGLGRFEQGPQLFPSKPTQIHNAVLVRGDTLEVFYTRDGDTPERILHSRVNLGPDWSAWTASPPEECLAPETEWEGANLPLTPAHIGPLDKPERALRDPALLEDGKRLFLFYAVAGESGIAIAELKLRQ